MKPYPEYRDSGQHWLGEIPNHWGLKRLKFLANNVVVQKSSRDDDEVYIALENIESWTGKITFKDEEVQFESSVKCFESSDVLFGKLRPYLAKCVLTNQKGVCVGELLVLRTKDGALLPQFVHYCMLSAPFINVVNSSTFGAKMPRADWAFIGNLGFHFPHPTEQSAIVAFLDRKLEEIDLFITNKLSLIELLKEQKTAIINRAVTRGINPDVKLKPSGIEWLGEIPEHWETVKTKYLFKLIVDMAPKNNDMELLSIYTDIGVRPRKELEERGNKASTTDGYFIVQKGDIIVNKLLAWMGAIGVSEYFGVTSPAYDILRKRKDLDSKFYHYLFRCGLYYPVFRQRSKGIMDMRLRLYFDEFGQIPLPYPPPDEQTQVIKFIETELGKVDEAIAKAERQIELMQEYRTTLISDVVTGKIDVRDEVEEKKTRRANKHFFRSVLAAEIVDQLHDEPTFGKYKLQKVLHLSEYHCQLPEIDSQPLRDAAGPHDNRMIRSIGNRGDGFNIGGGPAFRPILRGRRSDEWRQKKEQAERTRALTATIGRQPGQTKGGRARWKQRPPSPMF